ncbi:MAG TPA: hypothetical protein VF920_14220, partial [Dongiaceae bacterium]
MLVGICSSNCASASSDYSCGPSWSLASTDYDPCNSVPFLSPTNDTRVNLRLLIADSSKVDLPGITLSDFDRTFGYGLVPFPMEDLWTANDTAENSGDISVTLASGDGSRCRSNNADTAQAFIDQVGKTSGLSEAERNALTEGRQAFVSVCDSDVSASIDNLQSAQSKEFALYLTGARAFYSGDFPTAQQAFAGLGNSSQAWLKETALYMMGRNALNAAQVRAFDEMGFPKLENADQGQLKLAEAGFKVYLQEYPQGLYAASARGLMRRVYWLMSDQEHLADAYGDAIARGTLTDNQAMSLAKEADNKLLTGVDPMKIKDPFLLAILDLMAMRQSDGKQQVNGSPPSKPFTARLLRAQQPLFASHQELYAYLVAATHYYVEKDPAQTLATLPKFDNTKAITTYLAFSEAMLRGLTLEATGNRAEAQAFWTHLFPQTKQTLARPTLELALAINLQNAHKLDAVFEPNSLITGGEIRSFLVLKSAGPALLRQQIKAASTTPVQRDTALFVLLYKDLTRGHYGDFAGDLKLAPLNDQSAVIRDAAYVYFDRKADLSIFAKSASAENGADTNYACPTLEKV